MKITIRGKRVILNCTSGETSIIQDALETLELDGSADSADRLPLNRMTEKMQELWVTR